MSEKRVDESWKDQVARERETPKEKEKETPAAQEDRDRPKPETSEMFVRFLSGLIMQALSALGDTANPMTGLVEENLEQAKYLIDTIGVLEEKTRQNLSEEEERMFKESLYALRMKYVQKQPGEAPNEP